MKHTQEKLEAKIAQLLSEHQQVDSEENRRQARSAKNRQAPESSTDERVADELSKESLSASKDAQSEASEVQHAQDGASFDADGQVYSQSMTETWRQDTRNSGQESGEQRWADRLKR